MVVAHPPSKIIRVLVADDHPVVRDGLAAVLNTKPCIDVVAQVSNGREVVEQFRQHQPDVAIVDLRMPEMDGVAAISTVRAEFPNACFIMLTIYDGDEAIFQGFRAGAKAYLLKDTPCDEIVEIIQSVCEGQRYVPTAVGEKLATRTERPGISDRELQVLKLMAMGKSNKQMAADLTISEGTIKFHVNQILNKLGVHDRTYAVVTALKRDIISL